MKTPLALAALAATLLVTPAGAQQHPSPVDMRIVPVADLDLNSHAGMATLRRRVDQAVRELCGETADFDLAGRNEIRRCRNGARDAAAVQIERVRGARYARIAAREPPR